MSASLTAGSLHAERQPECSEATEGHLVLQAGEAAVAFGAADEPRVAGGPGPQPRQAAAVAVVPAAAGGAVVHGAHALQISTPAPQPPPNTHITRQRLAAAEADPQGDTTEQASPLSEAPSSDLTDAQN